jgi:hypothetical protein
MTPAEALSMKASTVMGILLVLIGLTSFIYPRLSVTREEKVFDAGPLEVTKKNQHTVALPPILGGIALVGGVILIVAGARRR